jgi:hypothetical protein
MELLLNLLWLLLAMPAFWLWRSSRTAPQIGKFQGFQTFLALGCLLVILFPVVSATDDLHAMRAEMEESQSKRSICQSASDKPCSSKWQSQPALTTAPASFAFGELAWHWFPASASSTSSTCVIARSSRAPPRSVLA